MSDPVDYVPFETTTAPVDAGPGGPPELERLYDVPVELAVEIGRTRMTIRETLALGPGSIVTLNRLAGEPVDLLVNGKPIARGEVVVIDEEFGLRVTEVVAADAAEVGEAPVAETAPEPGAARSSPPHCRRSRRAGRKDAWPMGRVRSAVAGFWRKAYEDNLTGLASMVAYNLLLSIFPIALVALFVAGRVLRSADVQESVLLDLERLFPQRGRVDAERGGAAAAGVLDHHRDRRRWSPRSGSRPRSGARSTPRSAGSTTGRAAPGCARSSSRSGCSWSCCCSSSPAWRCRSCSRC